MLITKFNKMIRNKTVWAIFAIVVSLSFVGFLGPRSGGCRNAGKDGPRPGVAGRLYGEDVPQQDLMMARFFELNLREERALTPEQNEMVRQHAWRRLLCLREAARMGITVSRDELADALRNDSSFADNGVFSKPRYDAVLRHLRISDDVYEEYLRQELTMRKMLGILQSMLWTAPTELNRKVANLTDAFRLEYVTLEADDDTGTVAVADEDLRAYYDANRSEFEEPEKVNVRYVSFPVSNYLAAAGAEVTEDDITDYYNGHLESYKVEGTNTETLFQPIEDVRDGIVAALRDERARQRARDVATEFVMRLAPSRFRTPLPFDQAAASNGLAVGTTAFFSASQLVPDLKAGFDLTRTAFALEAGDPTAYFSDAVDGLDDVYVLAAQDRTPARIPEFDEVTNAVRQAAAAKARREAFEHHAAELHDTIAKKLDEGATFAAAAAACGLNVTTSKVFNVYAGAPEDLPYSRTVITKIMGLGAGELAPVIEVPGAAVLAYVAERRPGDITSSELLKPQLIATLDRYRARTLFEDWADNRLKVANFKDFALAAPGDDEQSGDAEPKGDLSDLL